jgi:hypothetical protein
MSQTADSDLGYGGTRSKSKTPRFAPDPLVRYPSVPLSFNFNETSTGIVTLNPFCSERVLLSDPLSPKDHPQSTPIPGRFTESVHHLVLNFSWARISGGLPAGRCGDLVPRHG